MRAEAVLVRSADKPVVLRAEALGHVEVGQRTGREDAELPVRSHFDDLLAAVVGAAAAARARNSLDSDNASASMPAGPQRARICATTAWIASVIRRGV